MKRYTVTLTGWGHTSTMKVQATSQQEAIVKAQSQRGITAEAREAT